MGANQDLVCDMDNCLINTKLDSSSFSLYIYILKYARGRHGHCASLERRPLWQCRERRKRKETAAEHGIWRSML